MNEKNMKQPGSLFSTVMRDLHFWIPLIVLLAGLIFLREIR